MTTSGFQRILVANDSAEGISAALNKALALTSPEAAEVRVLTTCYDPIAEEPAEVLPRERRVELIEAIERRQAEAVEAAVDGTGVAASTLWTREATDTIVHETGRWPAALLVKPASAHHGLADYLFTPLDWALMRRVACPVLVSRDRAWTGPHRLLAAVDAGDTEHAHLSRDVLRRAHAAAAALDGELHVVTAYPDLGQAVNELQVASDFRGIKEDMRDSRRQALAAMIEDTDADVAEVHLLEGRPTRVIPALAERLGATVTVLGTAAREGLAKLVIGNTAEDLITRLPGDLMTVRTPWN